jgi:hypothetical protein
MPFHVEVRSSYEHARVFNLNEAELERTTLDPWVRGRTFEFGEQEWEPRESRLTILEGRALDAPDLAFGQGWSNALRSAEDVTRKVIESAELRAPVPTAGVVEADSLEEAVAQIKSGDSPISVEWSAARERIDGRDPSVAAVILVLRRSEPEPPRS